MGRKQRHSSSSQPSGSQQHDSTTIIMATILGKDLQPEHKLLNRKILVQPKPPFLDLLKTIGAKGKVFTTHQILQFLIKYIEGSQLYDPSDPRKVYCENDQLGTVFGVKMFTIKDARKLIFSNVEIVSSQAEKDKGDFQQSSCYYTLQHNHCQTSGNASTTKADETTAAADECDGPTKEVSKPHTVVKRTRSSSTGSRSSKKRSILSVSASEKDEAEVLVPWYAKKYPFDDLTSLSTDQQSIQDKATVVVTNSSDDLWFLEEDQLEFEIESETSSESYRSITSSGDSDLTEAIFEVEVRGGDSILGDVDSDTDSTDTELSERDKWECNECETTNPPYHGYCMGCWALRKGWLADEKRLTLTERLMSQRRCLSRSLSAPSDMRLPHEGIRNNLLMPVDTCDGVGKGPNTSSDDEKAKTDIEIKTRTDIDQAKVEPNEEGEDEAGIGTRPKSPVSSSDTVILENVGVSSCSDALKLEMGYHPTPIGSASTSRLEPRISGGSEEPGISATSSSYPLSTDDASTSNKTARPNTLCTLCLSRTKNASIIHGKSAHQVCCYSCAKKLRRHGKPCPVCRRKIQHVVKNYFV